MILAGRVLLVSPAFHGYHRAIESALAQRYAVQTHVYDAFTTFGSKLRTKAFELSELIGRDATHRRRRVASGAARRAVLELRPDVVLVVKGDLLDDEFWTACDQAGARTVLWLYDELRRTRWDREQLSRVGAVASYSSVDVAALKASGVPASHVPLGFDASVRVDPRPRSTDITFIGARYPQREALLQGLNDVGVPVRAYGRDWSHDVRDRLRTWWATRPDLPTGRDLDRMEAYSVMAASAATLNVHGDQDGFTMRTFESSGVGGIQLCDRPEVEHYLDPGTEVLVFDGVEEILDHRGRLQTDTRWAESVRVAGRARVLAEHTIEHRVRALEALWA